VTDVGRVLESITLAHWDWTLATLDMLWRLRRAYIFLIFFIEKQHPCLRMLDYRGFKLA
jgi:hypothetical protein